MTHFHFVVWLNYVTKHLLCNEFKSNTVSHHVVTLFVTVNGIPGRCWGRGGASRGLQDFREDFVLVARVFVGFPQMYVEYRPL